MWNKAYMEEREREGWGEGGASQFNALLAF